MAQTTDGERAAGPGRSAIAALTRERLSAGAGLLSLLGLVCCLVAANLWLVLTQAEGLVVTLAQLLAPVSATATAAFAVRRSRRYDAEGSLRHVAKWAAAGTAIFGLSGAAEQLFLQLQGVLVEPTVAPVFGWACGGFDVGAVVGLYSARLRAQREQTERAHREAEQLAEAQNVLNRVLRHDIRNNVNIVEGYVDLVASEDADPEYVETIRKHTSRIVRLAEYAREAERLVSREGAEVETVELVGRLTRIRRSVEAEYPDARLATDFPDRAPVRAHDFIDSAFENLLENAIEHHPGAQPEVHLSVTREGGADGEEVVVTVADDGAGIPETEVSVFESGSETRLEHSSGMGLWLVKWIVASSDGELQFVKNDDSGSEIAIRLPADERGPDGSA